MSAERMCDRCGSNLVHPRSLDTGRCRICRVAVGEPEIAEPAGEPIARKDCPVFSGCLNYFPDALLAVARLSKIGNDKHNPGEPLHWARDKSADHADCLARHLIEHGQTDPETGLSHTVAVAWRALALLQTEIEAARKDGAA